MTGDENQFLYVDLSLVGEGGKPFDGMAAGKFTDMYGREVEFKTGELAEYVRNTQAVLESTRDSNGEVVGLPIDALNHDHAEAAGWIIAVELAGSVIRFTPRWTDRGRELISGNIMRYFSPSVDLTRKIILGGSLTNWPATRDAETGAILLKPVELSAVLGTDAQAAPGGQSEMTTILDDLKSFITSLFNRKDSEPTNNGGESPADLANHDEVIKMDVTREELTAMIAESVKAALASQPAAQQNKAEFSALVDAGLSEEVKAQRKAELEAYMASERAQAELEFRAQLERTRFEGKMTELAVRLTGGTDAHPYGLRVGADELKAHLMKLDADEAKFWTELLTGVQERGLIEFGEAGHGRVMQGTRELPAEIKRLLESWLKNGGDLTGFFKANAVELGAMSDYNLAQYQEEK
jgi:hypothetical protein